MTVNNKVLMYSGGSVLSVLLLKRKTNATVELLFLGIFSNKLLLQIQGNFCFYTGK